MSHDEINVSRLHCSRCRPETSTKISTAMRHWDMHGYYTPCSKTGDTKLIAVTVLILNQFSKFFTVRFSSKFAAKHLLKIPPHLVCVAMLPCGTLMSENEQLSQTNVVICVVHSLLLLAVWWPGAQSAWDNHLVCQLLTDLKKSLADSAINLSILVINNPTTS